MQMAMGILGEVSDTYLAKCCLTSHCEGLKNFENIN